MLPFELLSGSGDSCQRFIAVPEDFHRYHSPLPSGKTIDRVKRGGFAGVGEVEPDLGFPPGIGWRTSIRRTPGIRQSQSPEAPNWPGVKYQIRGPALPIWLRTSATISGPPARPSLTGAGVPGRTIGKPPKITPSKIPCWCLFICQKSWTRCSNLAGEYQSAR